MSVKEKHTPTGAVCLQWKKTSSRQDTQERHVQVKTKSANIPKVLFNICTKIKVNPLIENDMNSE